MKLNGELCHAPGALRESMQTVINIRQDGGWWGNTEDIISIKWPKFIMGYLNIMAD